jgi:RecA/RadA recombinase
MSGAEEETGGKALKYYPDYRIMVTRRYKVDVETSTKIRRIQVNWRTVKNRLFPPMKIMEDMAIVLGRGVDKAEDATRFLEAIGCMEFSGRGRSGKRKILLPDFDDKFMSWADFRELTERDDVREHFFEMMEDQETFDRYDATMEDVNLVYDVKRKEERAAKKKAKKSKKSKKRTAKKRAAKKTTKKKTKK